MVSDLPRNYTLFFDFLDSHTIGTKPDREWVRDALAWVDEYVFYRSWKDIRRVFSRFFEIESYTVSNWPGIWLQNEMLCLAFSDC